MSVFCSFKNELLVVSIQLRHSIWDSSFFGLTLAGQSSLFWCPFWTQETTNQYLVIEEKASAFGTWLDAQRTRKVVRLPACGTGMCFQQLLFGSFMPLLSSRENMDANKASNKFACAASARMVTGFAIAREAFKNQRPSMQRPKAPMHGDSSFRQHGHQGSWS